MTAVRDLRITSSSFCLCLTLFWLPRKFFSFELDIIYTVINIPRWILIPCSSFLIDYILK